MKAHALRATKMEGNNLGSLGSLVMIVLNFIMGIISMEAVNLAVAALGVVAVLASNIVKIVLAFRQLRELSRNRWGKKPQQDNDAEK